MYPECASVAISHIFCHRSLSPLSFSTTLSLFLSLLIVLKTRTFHPSLASFPWRRISRLQSQDGRRSVHTSRLSRSSENNCPPLNTNKFLSAVKEKPRFPRTPGRKFTRNIKNIFFFRRESGKGKEIFLSRREKIFRAVRSAYSAYDNEMCFCVFDVFFCLFALAFFSRAVVLHEAKNTIKQNHFSFFLSVLTPVDTDK